MLKTEYPQTEKEDFRLAADQEIEYLKKYNAILEENARLMRQEIERLSAGKCN